MMNIIKSLIGEESLLLILPKKVGAELNIANQDLLKFEVENRHLVIKKLEFGDNVSEGSVNIA
jgi:antitoxin component of MazEF toxin-antitoxin module